MDTEVSHIVERIFQMKIDGYSSKAIADFLNSIGLVTPSRHKENSGKNFSTGFVVKNSKWDSKTVNSVIQNKVYTGVLEQGKTAKLNYKSKKEVKVSKEDWIITEDAHEGIVSKSVFALANKKFLRDVKRSKEKLYLLSGMLYCKDCGSSMISRTLKNKGSESSLLKKESGTKRFQFLEILIIKSFKSIIKCEKRTKQNSDYQKTSFVRFLYLRLDFCPRLF